MHLNPRKPLTLLLTILTSTLIQKIQTTNTSVPATPCTHPAGLANTFVPAPATLGASFSITPAFASSHTLFTIPALSSIFSEASISTLCLENCIAYPTMSAANETSKPGPCLSYNVYLDEKEGFSCTGFDAFVAADGSDYVEKEGFLFPISVNRECGVGSRAY